MARRNHVRSQSTTVCTIRHRVHVELADDIYLNTNRNWTQLTVGQIADNNESLQRPPIQYVDQNNTNDTNGSKYVKPLSAAVAHLLILLQLTAEYID
jgi:hypothetical protein